MEKSHIKLKVIIKSKDKKTFEKTVSKYINAGFIPIKTTMPINFFLFKTKWSCLLERYADINKLIDIAIDREDYEIAEALKQTKIRL